jgi:hypothetical protein
MTMSSVSFVGLGTLPSFISDVLLLSFGPETLKLLLVHS